MAIVAPLPWWRLPFAMALVYQAKVHHRCQLCGINDCAAAGFDNLAPRHHEHWFNRQQFLCQPCHSQFAWSASFFTLQLKQTSLRGVASGYYQYPLNQIMLGYKNGQQLHHLPVLIQAIRQLHIPKGCHSKNSLIVKVPTSLQRIRQRGFDPLAILTAYLSFHWQIPVFTGLQRLDRPHQQGLSREERLDNIKDAFSILDMPPSKHLILFDDVVTTGATLSELANLLTNYHPSSHIHAYSVLHGKVLH